MRSTNELDDRAQYPSIYDEKPRQKVWPYLRWHHCLASYLTTAVFHATRKDHSDCTVLGCGGNVVTRPERYAP